jgi:hypothetical protein
MLGIREFAALWLGVEYYWLLDRIRSLISLTYRFLSSLGSRVSGAPFLEDSMSLRTLVRLKFLDMASTGSLLYTRSKLAGETNWVGVMSR